MTGVMPSFSVFSTISAARVQVSVISFRYRALWSPDRFVSAMATLMLPPSRTSWPRASSRASSPATRTADGPISTPRREAPRSRGTPMTLILRGGSDCTPRDRGAEEGVKACDPAGCDVSFDLGIKSLRVDAIQRPGEGNSLAHVIQPADPCHRALDAHAEARMRNRTVPPQIEIPPERIDWQLVFFDSLLQQIVGVNTLRSADHLAVTFRRKHIDAQRIFW